MGNVVELVPRHVSEETVRMFRLLHEAAARGDIVGAAVAYNYAGPGRHFALIAAGAALKDPTHTRGTLNQFDNELARLPQRSA